MAARNEAEGAAGDELIPPEADGPETAPVRARRGAGARLVNAGVLSFRVLAALWSDRRARIGLVALGLIVFVAIFAPLISPYSPTQAFVPNLPPGGSHLLGTMPQGQDVLAELLYGTRNSLVIALAVGVLTIFLSTVVGVLSGYFGGPVGSIVNFVASLVLLIPGLPLIIVLGAYITTRNTWVTILLIVATSWAFASRVIRAQVLSLRERDYVLGAYMAGDSRLRIAFREVLPNMISVVVSAFCIIAAGAVITAAGLAFLGLSDPFAVSWGNMLYWAQNGGSLPAGRWGQIVPAGLCIALLASSFSLVNFGVDLVSNPKLRES